MSDIVSKESNNKPSLDETIVLSENPNKEKTQSNLNETIVLSKEEPLRSVENLPMATSKPVLKKDTFNPKVAKVSPMVPEKPRGNFFSANIPALNFAKKFVKLTK